MDVLDFFKKVWTHFFREGPVWVANKYYVTSPEKTEITTDTYIATGRDGRAYLALHEIMGDIGFKVTTNAVVDAIDEMSLTLDGELPMLVIKSGLNTYSVSQGFRCFKCNEIFPRSGVVPTLRGEIFCKECTPRCSNCGKPTDPEELNSRDRCPICTKLPYIA